MKHLLDEYGKDDVETVGGLGIGGRRHAGPQPAFEIGLAFGGDLMGALDRVKRAHVKRNGEQLDVHRGLVNRIKRGRVDILEFRIPRCPGAQADCAWHDRSPLWIGPAPPFGEKLIAGFLASQSPIARARN